MDRINTGFITKVPDEEVSGGGMEGRDFQLCDTSSKEPPFV